MFNLSPQGPAIAKMLQASVFFSTFFHPLTLAGATAPITVGFDNQTTPMPIQSTNALGLSFEFFAFPSYMTEVKQTTQCLVNLEDAAGAPPSIRIGGTTQDRAVFDPKQKQPIRYSLPPREKVPQKISFGPHFIQLASRLNGPTTIGFNRRAGDLENVGLAALAAVQQMKNLYAIELGNEPEYWGPSPPEARGKHWNPEADSTSQIRWQRAISEKVDKQGLIQAGVFLLSPRWSVAELAPKEGESIKYVQSFGGHAYPQSACGHSKTSLPKLMAHSGIVDFVKRFKPEVLAAEKAQRPYHFSETNSATCGGQGISATFGAGLWLMDYFFQSLVLGVHRLYFHQGTINHSPYSFWNQTQVSPTYYGAYFTALALHRTSHLSMLNASDPEVAVYGLWRCEQMVRMVVYNSKFSDGHQASSSPDDTVIITRLPPSVAGARLLRLAAKHAFVGAGGPAPGQVQIGGAHFDDATCKISAPPKYEAITVKERSLQLRLRPSEAVIIELDRLHPNTC